MDSLNTDQLSDTSYSRVRQFLFGNTALFIPFLNVFGLSLLLVCVGRLISAWYRRNWFSL